MAELTQAKAQLCRLRKEHREKTITKHEVTRPNAGCISRYVVARFHLTLRESATKEKVSLRSYRRFSI